MKRAHGWTIIPALAGMLCAAAATTVMTGCGGGPSTAKTTPAPAPAEDDEAFGPHRARGPEIDEEEDDGLQIEGLGGRLDVYSIRQGLEPHAGALNDCHASRQRRRRYIGGDVELAFVVNPDGTVKTVRLSKSDLGAWPMEQCLLEASRQMVFPEPEGNGEADFTVPLRFPSRGRMTVWDAAQAQAEAAEHLADLAACAADTGTEEPQSVLITLYVGTRGQVQSVGFAAPAAPVDDAWATCAEAKAMAWTLTDPRGLIAKMTFAYPAPEPVEAP